MAPVSKILGMIIILSGTAGKGILAASEATPTTLITVVTIATVSDSSSENVSPTDHVLIERNPNKWPPGWKHFSEIKGADRTHIIQNTDPKYTGRLFKVVQDDFESTTQEDPELEYKLQPFQTATYEKVKDAAAA